MLSFINMGGSSCKCTLQPWYSARWPAICKTRFRVVAKSTKGSFAHLRNEQKALSIVIASDCSLILCWSFKIMSTFFWFLLGFWWKLIPPHWLKRGHFMLIHWFMGWDLPRISWNIERYQNIKSYTVNWTSNMDFTGIVVGSPSSQPSRSPHLSWWISTGKFLDSATWTRSHPKD